MTRPSKLSVMALGCLSILIIGYFAVSKAPEDRDNETSTEIESTPVVSVPVVEAEQVGSGAKNEAEASIGTDIRSEFPSVDRSPYAEYLANIKAAEDGDARSQFLVSDALSDCAGLPESEAKIRAIEQQAILSSDQFQKMVRRFERCKEMKNNLSDLELEGQKWFGESVKRRDPLAMSKLIRMGVLRPKPEEASEILSAALSSGHYRAFEAMSTYIQLNLEADPNNVDVIRQTAWSYMACEANPLCDVDSAYENLFGSVSEAEYSETLLRIEQYTNAINSGHWSEIGL